MNIIQTISKKAGIAAIYFMGILVLFLQLRSILA